MRQSSLLPGGFETLEPFAEFWAADTAAKRAHCRDISNESSRQDFYDAAVRLIPLALEYLVSKYAERLCLQCLTTLEA